jgi:hypothetical protein
MLTPLLRHSTGIEQAYERDDAHAKQCRSESCPRCYFEAGIAGRLRRGQTGEHESRSDKSWAAGFTFYHLASSSMRTWICVRPYAWGGPFGAGCWLCNCYGEAWRGSFAKVEVFSSAALQKGSFQLHAGTQGHIQALAKMSALASQSDAATTPGGLLTGLSDSVPRADRFVLAATVVCRNDSHNDWAAYVRSMTVGSILQQCGDASQKACLQIVHALAEPLRQRDISVIRSAIKLHLLLFACRLRCFLVLAYLIGGQLRRQ